MTIKLGQKDFKVREQPPKLNPTKNGVQVLCPFCNPPHALIPGEAAVCGTTLRVTAVQPILIAHASKFNKIKCLKCHQFGGEMVMYNTGYIHLADCMPGTRLLTQPPKFSKNAKMVFGLPKGLRDFVEKSTGKVQQVREIDAEGTETGRILGYFFLKPGKDKKAGA
jgi:hypothetical protein